MGKTEQVALEIKNVYKDFSLPHQKVNSVKSIFTNPFQAKESFQKEVQHALSDISFEVAKGEFFGILGRNGSGKSTLLKLIAGIYQPTKGQIQVHGKLVPFIELGVGFNSELTGRENVYLSGALMGYSTKDVEERYEKIVEFAELERFMDQTLKNYSSGMQVRLAFSVATMLANSEILLIDEVLAVGDADFQKKCYDYFSDLKKQNKTVIFVTHDMNAVREYCDRAILIDNSKIVATGTANEIAKEYSKLFISNSTEDSGDEKQDRWGTREAYIKSVTLDKKLINESHTTVKLNMDVESTKTILHPVIGFSIKDSKGTPLLGINNTILEYVVNELSPQHPISLEWCIPNVFNDGSYTVSCAVVGKDGVTYDWWEDAVKFRSKRQIRTPYPLSIDIKLDSKTLTTGINQ